MKHSVDELLDIVYRCYPRGVGMTDDGDIDVQRCMETEEHERLVRGRIPDIEGISMALPAASRSRWIPW